MTGYPAIGSCGAVKNVLPGSRFSVGFQGLYMDGHSPGRCLRGLSRMASLRFVIVVLLETVISETDGSGAARKRAFQWLMTAIGSWRHDAPHLALVMFQAEVKLFIWKSASLIWC